MTPVPKFPIEVPIRGVDKISGVLGRIQRRVDRTTLPFKRLQRSVGALKRVSGVSRLTDSVSMLGGRLRNVASQVGSLASRFSLLAAGAGAAVFAIVNGFARAGDTLVKTSTRIGLSVGALQEFQFVADRSGVATSVFDQSLLAFTKRLGEAKNGTGALVTFLGKYDAALLEQLKSTTDTEKALEILLERMEQTEDVQVRNALAAAAFSRAGVSMVQMAANGAGEIRRLRDEARSLGGVMDDASAQAGVGFVDAMTNVRFAIIGVRNRIAGALLPVVQDLIEKLTTLVRDNGPRIREFARSFAARLPERLETLRSGFNDLIASVRPFIDLLAPLVEKVGLSNLVVGFLSLSIATKLVPAVLALIPATTALGAALLTTPVGWLIGGVAAIIAAFVLLRKHWGAVTGFFVDSWEVVKSKVGAIWNWIVEKVKSLTDILPDWLKDKLGLSTASSLAVEVGSERLSQARGLRTEQITRQEASVRVQLEGLPSGSRVSSDSGGVPLELDLGFANAATG